MTNQEVPDASGNAAGDGTPGTTRKQATGLIEFQNCDRGLPHLHIRAIITLAEAGDLRLARHMAQLIADQVAGIEELAIMPDFVTIKMRPTRGNRTVEAMTRILLAVEQALGLELTIEVRENDGLLEELRDEARIIRMEALLRAMEADMAIGFISDLIFGSPRRPGWPPYPGGPSTSRYYD